MRWFRTRAKWGASLASFALALQLALSFGHIHHKDIAAEAHSINAGGGSLVGQAKQQQPAEHDSDDHEDQYCAIYAINNLLGCSQPAEPPALLLAPHNNPASVAIGCENQIAKRRHVLSQARAPPTA